ncbi:hypothetical protein WJX73_000912 [Symbiochloris irregularis]|uniref:Uncharacterized protein n=1 Tax=Symbiochloris irregularis TaxID=706552 RepID=A0AAW1NUR8_9CHLO
MGKKSRRREKEPEHKSDASLSGCDLDPGTLPRWGELHMDFITPFYSSVGSMGELLMNSKTEMQTNAWLSFRALHAATAKRLLEGAPLAFALGNDALGVRVLFIVKGIRRTPAGEPLLEVIFSCPLGDRRAKGLPEMQSLMIAHTDHESGIPYTFPVSALEVVLMKQVLEANAARLAPEYKQRCKREWTSTYMPAAQHVEVSFITIHYALTPDQIESVRTCCANGNCCLPTSSRCSSCQMARYCSRHLAPPNVHGTKRFRVTVQLGHVHDGDELEDTIGGHPHHIQDEDNSLDAYVGHDQPGFFEILRVIMWLSTDRRTIALEACFWCNRASDTSLRIHLSGMPREVHHGRCQCPAADLN